MKDQTKRKWGRFPIHTTIGEAISNAKSEIDQLQSEMEEWAGNMEGTGLENTQKYEDVNSTAEILASAASPLEDIDDDKLGTLAAQAIDSTEYRSRRFPRHERLDNAVTLLQSAKEPLEETREKVQGEIDDPAFENADHTERENALDMLDEVISALDDAINELESVEFPGMF